MMSKKWCEQNKAERPVDKRKGIENTASFKANGTGPFRLKERDPGTRTVLVRNFGYWDKVDTNVDEVVFTPIGSDATRVAALLSGEIDLMQPVPLQDVERVKASATHTVLQGPELRTIFLGMDQKRDELLFSSVKGKNPFKDVRVRKAFYQAIDIETIKTRVMRGAATPTALMVGPGVRGFMPDMNKRAAVRSRGGEEAARRGRLSERLRGRHELPERPLRQRRRDLPGRRRQPGAHRRQGQPHRGDEEQLFPEDPAPRHELLSARLDAEHDRFARRAVQPDGHADRQGPGPVQPGLHTATRSSTN